MKTRAILAAATAVGLSGCVATNFTQARTPCLDEVGKWCGFTTEIAKSAWRYALLAENAYEPTKDDPSYALPPEYTMLNRVPNNRHGLAYARFDRKEGETLVERIIAFRGTELTHLSDWFYGNIGSKQRKQALDVYDVEREALDAEGNEKVPIVVTGHSLGGALAMQVSLEHDVEAYIFNASPRFARGAPLGDARRVSVGERGEVLRALRRFKNMPVRDGLVINCRAGVSPIGDHSMRGLADCLTWIAAYADETAYASLGANKIKAPRVNSYCRVGKDGKLEPLPHPGVGNPYEAGKVGCDDFKGPP